MPNWSTVLGGSSTSSSIAISGSLDISGELIVNGTSYKTNITYSGSSYPSNSLGNDGDEFLVYTP
jgi:hypothetical protein